MKTIGIICEYNPFHNGHLYHINKIKEKYPDSILILCLNGYFLERGEISLLDKKTKTQLALENKIDIVIELPCLFGTQSADTFSETSITLLNEMGIDTLIFGSESNDLAYLYQLAKKQLEPNFTLQKEKGLSYPKQLNLSLKEDHQIKPNDLLGISYIKAILKKKYSIKWECIQRTNSYHDTTAKETIISAQNIRTKYYSQEDITPYLPKESKEALNPYNKELFFTLLKWKIITEDHLEKYLDVTEGIEHKLKKEIITSPNYEEFLTRIKSKRYTKNRLKRMLIHILLGIKKEDATLSLSYIKILGFTKEGRKYLNHRRKNFTLTLKPAKEDVVAMYEKKASLLYDMITYQNTYSFEKKNQPIASGSNESNQK